MIRTEWQTIHIEKDQANPSKGWGWIEIEKEYIKKLKIPTKHPKSFDIAFNKARNSKSSPRRLIGLRLRGTSGSNKFKLHVNGDLISIRAQKSLSVKAICTWAKTWAPSEAKIITPGNRTHSLDENTLSHQSHFVYFIANDDSNAIKIGHAKDLEKRIKALQTGSPARLRLVKFIQVKGMIEAQKMEKHLHQEFNDIRINGEWFKAEIHLLEHIGKL
jgi:predicted GIY-YIG superfamily endonuclease